MGGMGTNIHFTVAFQLISMYVICEWELNEGALRFKVGIVVKFDIFV